MRTVKFLNLIFISIVLLSCQLWDSPDYEFTYPIENGTTWNYERHYETIFDGDSIGFNDTYAVATTVINPDIILDSIEVIPIQNGTQISYYKQEDDGLYLYGYSNTGGEVILPKSTTGSKIIVNGRTFNNLEELLGLMQDGLSLKKSLSSDIYYEDPPIKVLAYPLDSGTSWIYRDYDNPFYIKKEIKEKRLIRIGSVTYKCFRIRYSYDFDQDRVADKNTYIDDYISKEGLIKREITVKDIQESLQDNQVVGVHDFYDTFELTSIVYSP